MQFITLPRKRTTEIEKKKTGIKILKRILKRRNKMQKKTEKRPAKSQRFIKNLTRTPSEIPNLFPSFIQPEKYRNSLGNP